METGELIPGFDALAAASMSSSRVLMIALTISVPLPAPFLKYFSNQSPAWICRFAPNRQ
jgi:hypothetical protein